MRLPAQLLKRKPDSNKGDFGHILVLAGSKNYCGAPCLCVNAALRSGAGLVTLGVPEGIHSIVAGKLTEGITLALPQTKEGTLSEKALKKILEYSNNIDCFLIGPGLSRNASTAKLVRLLLRAIKGKPVVLDADGINAFAGKSSILKDVDTELVLTPHPGEFARLMNMTVLYIQNNRKKVAKDFVLRYNRTLVLKGNASIVASPGRKLFVNSTGNAGMATAGSGDVLCGIVAAFIAQGLKSGLAAESAVYVHGLAADLAIKDKTCLGLIASDIIDYLPSAFKVASRR